MSESEKASESDGGGSGSTSTNTGTGGGGGEEAVAKPRKPRSSGGNAQQPGTKKAVRTRTRRKSKQLPPYNVILLDDNFHTYAYVIEILRKLFGHPDEKGTQLAKE